MAESTHKVEVVDVTLSSHPNADKLSVVQVFGYPVVVRTEDWTERKIGAYLPPDSLVDVTRPEFSFLKSPRIKAQKLRGVVSFGLLVPAPENSVIGDDVASSLGVTHYEPVIKVSSQHGYTGGEVAPAPFVRAPKYDVEAGRRYASEMFEAGEEVVVTEKIHGANARYVFSNAEMHCGSRTEWKREFPSHEHVTQETLIAAGVEPERALSIVENLKNKPKSRNLWWEALRQTPSLQQWCVENPGTVVYGEVFGNVQDLRYGHAQGEVSFRAFDVYTGIFYGFDQCPVTQIPWVPVVYRGPYSFDLMCELAEGPSLIPGADHIREGVVVKPIVERYHPHLGRVCLKWVSAQYLERAK